MLLGKRPCVGGGTQALPGPKKRSVDQSPNETRLCHSFEYGQVTPGSTSPTYQLPNSLYEDPESTRLDDPAVVKNDGLPYPPSTGLSATVGTRTGSSLLTETGPSSVAATYCFGMVSILVFISAAIKLIISQIIGSFALFRQSKGPSSFLFRIGGRIMLQLRFRADGLSIVLPATKEEVGIMDTNTAKALMALVALDHSITFEPYLHWKETTELKPQAKFFPINIIVYGEAGKTKEVGAALSIKRVYLQEPPSYNRESVYHNPHVLSWNMESTPIFLDDPTEKTMDFSKEIDSILNDSALVHPPSDLRQSPQISTTLLPHQLAALQFMVNRELRSSDSEQYSMWEPEYRGIRVSFKHKISQIRQATMTMECRGGILADEMGMGKSLTLLSLILHTLEEARRFTHGVKNCAINREIKRGSGATLLIAPKSTLYGWELQIKEHTLPDSLVVHMYHGRGTSATTRQLERSDIVLTTFETVSSDFIKSETLRNIKWFRIVLDEAHHIRNRATKTFQAIEDLVAERRWCLTGTPVQNQLDDLFSLTQFLRFHPLENHANARKYVLEPLGRGDKTALTNLRLAMQEISLRRTRSVTNSKQRETVRIDITLTPRERHQYVSIRNKVRRIANDNRNLQSHVLLLCVLYLRQLCSHGDLDHATHSGFLTGDDFGADFYTCDKCGETMPLSLQSVQHEESRACGHRICAECRLEEKSGQSLVPVIPECCICGQPIHSTFQKGGEAELSLQHLLGLNDPATFSPESRPPTSSKVHRVLDQLLQLDSENSPGTDAPIKSLVFSHWGKTLSCLETALNERSMSYVKIDGSSTREQRGMIIQQFQNERHIKIMLLTYASGSVGLNLAAATRVHLLEPHWNPMVETQAAARVDRLDQEKGVIIYHYVVKQSIEEHIIHRQRNKILLAKLSISNAAEDKEASAIGRKGLESLLE